MANLVEQGMKSRLRKALKRTQDYFFRTQHEDGYWWGSWSPTRPWRRSTSCSRTSWGRTRADRIPRVAEDIRRRQSEDGSWRMYYGAPGDLSTSIECYFALKLAGDPSDAPHMARGARIHPRAGRRAPPRLHQDMARPLRTGDWKERRHAPGHDAAAEVGALQHLPLRELGARDHRADDHHPHAPPHPGPRARTRGSWSSTRTAPSPSPWRAEGETLLPQGGFLLLDKALRVYPQPALHPRTGARAPGSRRLDRRHQEADGSWGGIQPPWVYSLIALRPRYPLDPSSRRGWRASGSTGASPRRTATRSGCRRASLPVWDTCLAMRGLLDSGVPPDHPTIRRAAEWLTREEIRVKGDWAVYRPHLEPSGWAFEFDNVTTRTSTTRPSS